MSMYMSRTVSFFPPLLTSTYTTTKCKYKKVVPTPPFCTKRPLAGILYCSPSPPLYVAKIWRRIEKEYIVWIYVFVYSLCFEYVFDVFVRCVEDMFFLFRACAPTVCVCVFDMCCMCLNWSSEFVLWNLSWTKWLIESKELLCSILHPSTTTKRILVPNSPCQPPWLTWNFWMSTLWQLVGFYVSMPCSQNLCKNVQIH